ncbi:MAG: NUDIX pyrophosphatase [Dehalococcoidia bacterium]|nr:NUDIX pyrophosphatase [Dehalococcoidia bacterium]
MPMDERHVVTCFLEHGGKIMILRRSGRVGTYRGRWAGVSGYIEEGTSAPEQAWTEIREECGVDSDDVELVREGQPLEVVDSDLGRKWIVHPFRFRVVRPDKVRIDWEHTEAKWVVPDDIGRHETVPKLLEAWRRVAG